MQPVTPNHPSAPQATPTRDPDAERGVGRAWRHEPNMLPQRTVAIGVQKAGMPAHRAWVAGKAVREDKGVLGKTGSLTVAVRSGNADPAAVGLNTSNWGLASIGAEEAAPAQSKLFLIGGLAALAAVFLLAHRKPGRA